MVRGRTILILQTDRAATFPLAAALRSAGWAVVSAQDAAFATSMARRQKPDGVILDSRLSGGGGVAALKQLRSSLHTTLIPVICIVDRDSPERTELAAAGAHEMLEPPGDPDAVNAALQRHVARPEGVMQIPPAVAAGPERLKALSASGLLDSPPDETFDRLTRLTTALLGVPTALLSIVDRDRQFFKSASGLEQPWSDARQTPLSHSFCQWVVGGNEEIAVDDARNDPVLRTNLAIRDMGVIAYAGIPVSAHREAIGSFCAIDSKPRQWTEEQLAALRDLSLIAQAYITSGIDASARGTKIDSLANGIGGAARLVLRRGTGEAERLELARIIEQQSHRLVEVASQPGR
jgi:CheY-like chemotaxis protein